MADPIARQLAKFIETNTIEEIPHPVIDRTKLYVLDTLGAVIAGADETSSKIISKVVSLVGGQGNCTVVGSGVRRSATGAALINGAAGHAVEIDDDHRTSALHPGTVVIPTAPAMTEALGCDGKALLAGVVAGYEVMIRVGNAFLGSQDSIGFHSTSTRGVFGATAAAGKVLNLNSDQLTAALGIAGSQAAGLQEWKSDGSWTKRLHAGKAAEAGILSAMLAAQGYTGPDTVFEGPYGFLGAYAGGKLFDADVITQGLGIEFRSVETAYKPFACCRFSHQLIDAVLHLIKEHEVHANDISQCKIRLYRSGYKALFEPAQRSCRPATVVDAQFSAPFIVAISILHGPPLPGHFTPEMLSDPEVLSMVDRISGEPDDIYEEAYPDSYPTHVTIHLNDGRKIEAFEEIPSGDPDKKVYLNNPKRFGEEIKSKFASLLDAAPAFKSKTGMIIHCVDHLDEIEDITTLTNHLVLP